MGSTIWTIGHSTRPLDAFLELLAHYRLRRSRMCGASPVRGGTRSTRRRR